MFQFSELSEQTEARKVDFKLWRVDNEKTVYSSLEHTCQAGRAIKWNMPYYYGSQEESVLVLSAIRACLRGVLVVNLD